MTRTITAINEVLYHQLPTGFFMATCIVEIASTRDSLRLWRGGMPECLLFGAAGQLRERIGESDILPLGIAHEQNLITDGVHFTISPGDRLYVFSDGITETANAENDLFGLQRMEAFIASRDPLAPLEDVLEALEAFHGSNAFSDDITLVEISP